MEMMERRIERCQYRYGKIDQDAKEGKLTTWRHWWMKKSNKQISMIQITETKIRRKVEISTRMNTCIHDNLRSRQDHANMKTWKHENMKTWKPKYQNTKKWKHKNMKTWKHENPNIKNTKTWKHENMKEWKHENMKTQISKYENMKTWKHENMKT